MSLLIKWGPMKQMKFGLFFILATLSVITYQQCSMKGSDSNDLPSTSGSTPPTAAGIPTLTVDSASMVLNVSASTLVATGTCSTSPYTQYVFAASYRETGASSSAAPKRIYAACVSGHYSLTVSLSDLQIRTNYPGVLSIKIIGVNAANEVEGPAANINISWPPITPPTPPPPPTPPTISPPPTSPPTLSPPPTPPPPTCTGGSWNYPGNGWNTCGECAAKAAEAGATNTCHIDGPCCTR